MGFYGQVVYEFKRIFSSLKVIASNPGEEAIAPPQEDESLRLQALQPWDELTVTPLNRWIQLNGNPDEKILSIGHSTPGEKDESKTVIGFAKIREEDIPEGVVPTPLNYGAFIETTNSNYDKAGHSIEATKSYFQLPISDTEQNVQTLQDNIEHIFENHLTTNAEAAGEGKGQLIETYLADNNFVQKEMLDQEFETYLTDEEHHYVTDKVVGNLYDLYPDYGYPPTITSTIGLVSSYDGYSSALNEKLNTNTLYTISDAIIILLNLIKKLESEITVLNGSNALAMSLINDLTKRIETLEQQQQV